MDAKQLNFFLILGSLIAQTACFTLGKVEIEVIKPAKIIIPHKVNSLVLVNNSLIYPSTEFKSEIQKGAFKRDTSATQILIKTVNDILNESPRFDTSIVLNDIYFRNSSNLLKPINWKNVAEICAKNSADALVSLEAFGIKDTVVRLSYFDGFTYTTFSNLVLISNSMWRIYLPNEKKIVEKRIYRDTIFIDDFSSRKEYLHMLTAPKFVSQLSQQIGLSGASKIADRMAPYWQPIERSFFIHSTPEMRTAADFAYKDNWRQAALIWKQLTDSENQKLAGAACHNMALVCEVEGRLDLAKVWLEESVEKYDNMVSKEYYKKIEQRIADTDKLNQQFGVE